MGPMGLWPVSLRRVEEEREGFVGEERMRGCKKSKVDDCGFKGSREGAERGTSLFYSGELGGGGYWVEK